MILQEIEKQLHKASKGLADACLQGYCKHRASAMYVWGEENKQGLFVSLIASADRPGQKFTLAVCSPIPRDATVEQMKVYIHEKLKKSPCVPALEAMAQQG